MEQITLKVKRINPRVDFPEVNPLTGEITFQSSLRMRVPGGTKGKDIPTGIAIEIPEGYYGIVMDSDQLRKGYPLHIMGVTLTSENREEIILNVTNYTPYPETIDVKQVIGKMLLYPIQKVQTKNVAKLKKGATTEE